MLRISWRLLAIGTLIAFLFQPVAAAHAVIKVSPPEPPRPVMRGAKVPAMPNNWAWYDGASQSSTVINCFSIIQGFPYPEPGVAAYVGFTADPNSGQPVPNTVYYLHVAVWGLGNPCSGTLAYIDLTLPQNTVLAIDAANPVYCFHDGAPLSRLDCPQSLPASSFNPGAYQLPSPDTSHGGDWPIAQGHNLEIQIPVRSSTVLSGVPFHANVWAIDGNFSPWLSPDQRVSVFNQQPTILYPSPSTISITANSAVSYAYLYAFNHTGTTYFDLGAAAGSYTLFHDPYVLTQQGTSWRWSEDWTDPVTHQTVLQPNTLYHFRFRFVDSNGQIYNGDDQTFLTLPAGRVTIGAGTPAGCTEAALTSALTAAKEITFDCGALPITLSLSGRKSIGTDTTIDGGNKVTLSSSGAEGHFKVGSGATLTLTRISLVNGTNTTDCGGSINVDSNAQLRLDETRFFTNTTTGYGGAVCLGSNSYANIYSSQFRGNSAQAGGGAIANFGYALLVGSDISNNSTPTNGGGIYNEGQLEVNTSLIADNLADIATSAATTGGGIYNGGWLGVGTSTVSGNFAKYGGGIYHVGNDMYVSNVTIANNVADPGQFNPGRMKGAGGLSSGESMILSAGHLRNTILAGNWPDNCSFFAVERSWTSEGNNLDSGWRCTLSGSQDLSGVNPRLGPLQNNGGRTRTHALSAGSPAIDAANNAYCGNVDQRGMFGPTGRAVDGNGDGVAVCDIGAYEYRPQVFLPLVIN